MDRNTIIMDKQACYAAFRAHDTRFDGRLFIGVSSTGIYCRPVCRVKMPKKENCTFHASAAAAESAGFRPCLKCRPELAPGNAAVDAVSRLARQAALAIEEDCQSSISELARTLDVTDRHLRRAFAAEYGVSPVQYLQTRKLLLAKHLLTDTTLSVTAVAMAAGFGSISRFNDLFRKRYRLSPRDLRKLGAKGGTEKRDGVTLLLGYRPPYAWDKLLAFLAGRAIPGIEHMDGGRYLRTAALPDGKTTHRGWIAVDNAPKKNTLAVTVSPELLPALPRVLLRLRALFDLNCDPAEIFGRIAALNDLSPGLYTPGLRLPGSFDPFEMAVRAVLGQQVTVKAARTLAMRFATAFGTPLETPFTELTHTFPSPTTIADLTPPVEDRLRTLGITGARARSIFALATALADGSIRLSPRDDPQEAMHKLLALPGLGPWTVHYLAMRALAWPDAFPHTDYGVKKALEGHGPEDILRLAEAWRPWRAYATIALWDSLNDAPDAGKGA